MDRVHHGFGRKAWRDALRFSWQGKRPQCDSLAILTSGSLGPSSQSSPKQYGCGEQLGGFGLLGFETIPSLHRIG